VHRDEHCVLFNVIVVMYSQGLAYTGFAAVLWPSVPLVVEEKFTGLAFGVVTSLINLACAVIPLIVAAVYNDSNHKYVTADLITTFAHRCNAQWGH
jgi:hypothetical protein